MRPFSAWPRIIGHRGTAGLAPENTLISFREAADCGTMAVHFDVMLSADGVPVVIADAMLERTTNGTGAVADHTVGQLKSLDAGSWFLPQFAGEPIPTLAEALKLCAALDLRVVLELRAPSGQEEALTRAVTRHIEDLWPLDRSLPLISSARPDCLLLSLELHPEWPRGLVLDFLPTNWREVVLATQTTTLHGNAKNPTLLLELVANGRPVYAFTVNDVKRARSLAALGITGLVTDYPDQMTSQNVLPPSRPDRHVPPGGDQEV